MTKKKCLMVTPQTKNAIFRADLMRDIIRAGYEMVVVIPEDESRDFFADNGIRTRLLEMDKNSTSVTQNIAYYRRLKQIIREEKPDVVFSYTIKPVIFGSVAARRAGIRNICSLVCGLGYVYSEHDAKHKVLQAICDTAYRYALRFNRKVIFQNRDDIDEFVRRRNLPREKCELVNGSGVNLERFRRNPLPEKLTFLMISRILKGKGVLEYFEAAKLVKQTHPEVRFVYIGQLDEGQSAIRYEDIKPFIDEGIVEYVPFTTHVEEYYEQSSVVVLPSYYREGIPRTLIEATAMGRPVLTTDTPGCRETLRDGENGWFVEPRSPEDLAKAMLRCIESPERLEEMGEKSYRLCLEKFDSRIINARMMQIMGITP